MSDFCCHRFSFWIYVINTFTHTQSHRRNEKISWGDNDDDVLHAHIYKQNKFCDFLLSERHTQKQTLHSCARVEKWMRREFFFKNDSETRFSFVCFFVVVVLCVNWFYGNYIQKIDTTTEEKETIWSISIEKSVIWWCNQDKTRKNDKTFWFFLLLFRIHIII